MRLEAQGFRETRTLCFASLPPISTIENSNKRAGVPSTRTNGGRSYSDDYDAEFFTTGWEFPTAGVGRVQESSAAPARIRTVDTSAG
jgi:hypothetical protein